MTVHARCCPSFAGLLRTQHGPTGSPIQSGRRRLGAPVFRGPYPDRPAVHGKASMPLGESSDLLKEQVDDTERGEQNTTSACPHGLAKALCFFGILYPRIAN
jgi:hypothetical protein